MKRDMNFMKRSSFFAALLILLSTQFKAQFTSTNIVVMQIGTGVGSLTNTGNPIILQEFTPLGVAAYSMAIPSTGTNALILGGTATSEGLLTLSQNSINLVFGAYNQALPNATNLASSSSTLIARGIGIVNNSGTYSLVATSSSFFTGSNIRSATTDGNNNYWAAGSNNGTNYFGTVGTPTTVQNVIANTRMVLTHSNNLYMSTGSGTPAIYQVGSGLPVVSGQTITPVISLNGIGVGSASPYGFYFNATQTVCYVADERSAANGGGIQRWNYSGSWSHAYTIGTGGTTGARGVVVDFSNAQPMIYATTADGTSNRLVAIQDVGALSNFTTLSTAAANTIYRGISFSPICALPSGTASTSHICGGNQTLSINPTGTSPFTYTWSGTGTIASPSASTTAVTGAAAGNYTVQVGNACGNYSTVVAATLNPAPNVSVSSTSTLICAGESATLTAGGAATYSWTTGAAVASVVISPTVNTTYTVTGIDACGSGTAAITMSVSACTGIASNGEMLNANIYPNPFNKSINIQFDNYDLKEIRIYDTFGKLVMLKNTNDLIVNIDTEELQSSVYIIVITANNERKTSKLLKY